MTSRWIILLGISLAAEAVGAGSLEGLGVPSQARVGLPVRITVEATAPKCGVMIDTGAVRLGPFVVDGQRTIETRYRHRGRFTIRAWGRKKDNKPACEGVLRPKDVVVKPRPFRSDGGQPTIVEAD